MKQYYYIDVTGKQVGPFSTAELLNQPITPATLVWSDGMPNWVAASAVYELQYLFEKQQVPPVTNYPMSKPDNYLVWAILVTVLCCLPFGIVAIIKSTEVNNYWDRGDVAGALRAAKQAKNWCIASALSTLIPLIAYIILAIATAGAAFSSVALFV